MKIAILGASKPHLALYQKAKKMGLETYCIAWNTGAYCKDYADHYYDISILDKERIAKLCIEEGISGIVSNAIEEAVPTLAYVSEHCGFNGNSYATAMRATNKLEMRKTVLKQDSCLQPNFTIVSKPGFVCDKFPVIVKPIDGSCSKGVTKVCTQSELDSAINRALVNSQKKEVLIEQFIDGVEVSVESISFHGIHYVLVITDKQTTGAPYFVELAHHQPSLLDADIQKKICERTKSILNALEIRNGASHIEFKIDIHGNIFFIEGAARGGGDLISYKLVELSTGYDYVGAMINTALDKFVEPQVDNFKYCGVYFLSKETEYLKDYLTEDVEYPWLYEKSFLSDMPLTSIKKSQDRAGYFIYRSVNKINLLK